MRYDVTWTIPNGEAFTASYDDDVTAKQEATYRANKLAMEHHSCQILVADETGQPILVQTNTYHA